MRVLQVHNFYRSSAPSGENNVVNAERELLTRYGIELETHYVNSDELEQLGPVGTLLGAAATPWNPFSASHLKTKVAKLDPDIVHAHNTFPLLSPSIFHSIKGRAGRVLTLHNYRTVCANGTPTRENQVCTACIDAHSPLPALKHGCYRNSRVATLPLALNILLHKSVGTWTRQIDAFIVLTQFQRDVMLKAGFPAELIHVKPNFQTGDAQGLAWNDRPPRIVFAGRLSSEKGISSLIEAWRLWGENAPELRIIGDGELRGDLQVAARGLPIKFMGQLPLADAKREIGAARLLVTPSVWYEGFPMVLQEALALGTPAAVSDIGALPDIVEHGRAGNIFPPNNPAALLSSVQQLWEDQSRLKAKGAAAREIFEEKYTEARNFQHLVSIYETAMAVKQERREGQI